MNDQIHQLYSLGVRDLRDDARIDTESVSPCPICQCQTARATFALENMFERVMTFSSLQAEWFGADWFHLDPPRHLYHIPVLALRQLLETSGFEVRSEHHFSLRHNPFGWVQSWLNHFPKLPRNGLYLLLQKHSVHLPFAARRRWFRRLMYYAMMPWALLLSIRDALVRRGATVHLVAVRPTGQTR